MPRLRLEDIAEIEQPPATGMASLADIEEVIPRTQEEAGAELTRLARGPQPIVRPRPSPMLTLPEPRPPLLTEEEKRAQISREIEQAPPPLPALPQPHEVWHPVRALEKFGRAAAENIPAAVKATSELYSTGKPEAVAELSEKPLVPLSELAPERGFVHGVTKAAESFTTPFNLSLLAAIPGFGSLAKAAPSLAVQAGYDVLDLGLGTYFTVAAAKGLDEAGQRGYEAWQKRDYEGVKEALGFGSVDALLVALLARGVTAKAREIVDAHKVGTRIPRAPAGRQVGPQTSTQMPGGEPPVAEPPPAPEAATGPVVAPEVTAVTAPSVLPPGPGIPPQRPPVVPVPPAPTIKHPETGALEQIRIEGPSQILTGKPVARVVTPDGRVLFAGKPEEADQWVERNAATPPVAVPTPPATAQAPSPEPPTPAVLPPPAERVPPPTGRASIEDIAAIDPMPPETPAAEAGKAATRTAEPRPAETPTLAETAPLGAAEAPREPWQMTREEFHDSFVLPEHGPSLFVRIDTRPKGSLSRGFSRPAGESGQSRHAGLSGYESAGLDDPEALQRLQRYWDDKGGLPTNAKVVYFRGNYAGGGPSGEDLFHPQEIVRVDPVSVLKGDPHRRLVEAAFREGKPVPPEVLADYPDLRPVRPATAADVKAIERAAPEPNSTLTLRAADIRTRFSNRPPLDSTWWDEKQPVTVWNELVDAYAKYVESGGMDAEPLSIKSFGVSWLNKRAQTIQLPTPVNPKRPAKLSTDARDRLQTMLSTQPEPGEPLAWFQKETTGHGAKIEQELLGTGVLEVGEGRVRVDPAKRVAAETLVNPVKATARAPKPSHQPPAQGMATVADVEAIEPPEVPPAQQSPAAPPTSAGGGVGGHPARRAAVRARAAREEARGEGGGGAVGYRPTAPPPSPVGTAPTPPPLTATPTMVTAAPANPISRVEILQEISKRLNDLPIRTGRFRQRALGIFKVREEVVRTKQAHNLPAAFHEIGHDINKLLWGTGRTRDQLNWRPLRPFRAELNPIGTAPYPDQSRLAEGFAEFVRMYVTDPTRAQTAAPNFLRWFEQHLDQNAPELKETLLASRQRVSAFVNQPDLAWVLGHISTESPPPPTLTFDALYAAIFDRLQPVKKVVDAMRADASLADDKNAYILMRLLAGGPEKANHFLEHGTFSPLRLEGPQAVTAPPLKEAMKLVENRMDEGRAYLAARRAIEKIDQGKTTGFEDVPDYRQRLERVLNQFGDADMLEHARLIDQYQSALLDYLVDARLYSREQAAQMQAQNTAYVPFYRVLEEIGEGERPQEGGPGQPGKTPANVAGPIKRYGGSARQIIDPYESIIKNTYVFISRADRNAAMLALVDQAAKTEGAGRYVERVPPDQVKITVPLERIKKDLEAAGADLTDADLDLAAALWQPDYRIPAAGTRVVRVMRDGKPEFYRLAPGLYEAVTGADEMQSRLVTAALNVLGAPARSLRAGQTGINLDFTLARNWMRDAQDAYFQSDEGFIPIVDTWRGIAHALGKDDVYWEAVRSGGMHAALASLDRKNLRKAAKELLQSGPQFAVRHPIEALRIIGEWFEAGTRLGSYGKARAAGKSAVGAGYGMREVTIDFQRRGNLVMSAINRLSAYYNSSLQGTDKFFRTHIEHPYRTMWRSLPYVAATLLLYLVNRDDPEWQAQERWKRDNFWLIPTKYFPGIGDFLHDKFTKFIPIPKPYLYGLVYSTVPERLFEYLDKKDPKAFDQLFGHALNSLLPGTYGLPVPTFAVPLIEWWANKDLYTGRSIEGGELEQYPPEMRAKPYTTEFSKLMAQGFARIGIHASPAKLDNLIYGYTGAVGRAATSVLNPPLRLLTGSPEPAEMDWKSIPLFGAFALREGRKPIDDVYERLSELRPKSKAVRLGGAPLTAAESRELWRLEGAARALSLRTRLIREVHRGKASPEEGRKRIDIYNKEMISIARDALGIRRMPERRPSGG